MTTKSPASAETKLAQVEAYLAGVPEPFRAALMELRAVIRAAAPDATEALVYGVPGFRLRGPLVCYAAFKAHCGFYPMNPALIERFAAELAGFATAKGTIQFTPDRPIPGDLVRRIVTARCEEDRADEARPA